MEPINLDGKVALVTGGASGIGAATATAFTRAGAAVVIADIDPAGNELATSLGQQGASAVFVETDVTVASQCERAVQTALESFGRLDFAHNNAGGNRAGRPTLWEYTEEDWDRVFNLNARAVWLSMKAEFAAVRETRGAIVNTASGAAIRIPHGAGAYNTAKATVIAMTRQAAKEMGRHGIRVNAVAPGLIDTPIARDVLTPEFRESIVAQVPLGRMGEPEDIANVVVWLCSPLAAFVNGATIIADGGLI